ncbi:MAG: helix-turn-helix domain-containing protein [Myxococcota bacterium]|nr:TetR/AcrR family transcriptional regulator [Myxococcales bacterium]
MAVPQPAAEVVALPRRERRKLELRARILEAARALFDDQGFDATRVAEIAERADVAEKTVFNHFATKQLMMRELAYEAIAALVERVEQVRREPGTTRERLARFFEQVADAAEEGGPTHRELLTETIHALHDARDESEQVKRLHDAFAGIVGDGVARGEITRAHAPETLANAILGSFYSLMFSWAHVEGFPVREQARATARFLADALAA